MGHGKNELFIIEKYEKCIRITGKQSKRKYNFLMDRSPDMVIFGSQYIPSGHQMEWNYLKNT